MRMLIRGMLASLLLAATACEETGEDTRDAVALPCVATSSCVDTGPVDTTPRRSIGQACEADLHCESGLCLDVPSDRYCTEMCEGACPADSTGAVYDCTEGRCVRRDQQYRWLILVDTSEQTEPLTPGADICGASYDCGGVVESADAAILGEGEGEVCPGAPGCTSARNDPEAALDDGVACADEADPSDYVSLGVGGELALHFDRGLRGCMVQTTDRAGAVPESYDIYVCADELRADCLNDGQPLWQNEEGGRHLFEVP